MENKDQPIGFALKKVTTEQFAILEESFVEDKPMTLSTGLRFGADKGNRMVKATSLIRFEVEKHPFLLIEASCHFEIEEKAWESFWNTETKSIQFPKGFMAHLAMITVGTTRGILHAKTENTRFNSFILPTINVADLIKEDVKF